MTLGQLMVHVAGAMQIAGKFSLAGFVAPALLVGTGLSAWRAAQRDRRQPVGPGDPDTGAPGNPGPTGSRLRALRNPTVRLHRIAGRYRMHE
jgi:hypothetical protein